MHELVLQGVGGRTVEELKQRMSYPEWLRWLAFFRQRSGDKPETKQPEITNDDGELDPMKTFAFLQRFEPRAA